MGHEKLLDRFSDCGGLCYYQNNMEHNDTLEMVSYRKRSEIQKWIFLALLIIAVSAMIYAITVLVKNKNIIQADALVYGMGEHGFKDCVCVDAEEQLWYSNGTGFMTHRYTDFHYMIEEIKDVNLTDIFNVDKEVISQINEKDKNGTN